MERNQVCNLNELKVGDVFYFPGRPNEVFWVKRIDDSRHHRAIKRDYYIARQNSEHEAKYLQTGKDVVYLKGV